MADIVVGDSVSAAFGVADRLIPIGIFWVARDDIPGVDQAGDVPQAAQRDVD